MPVITREGITAIDAYLQVDGIKGESTDDKHKDWIEVARVVWAVHQPRAATMSTVGGHTSGRAELSTCCTARPPRRHPSGFHRPLVNRLTYRV